MKNQIIFILFLTYSIFIFFIENYIALTIILILNICLMLITNVKLKNAIINLIKLFPFVLFTVIINALFVNIQFGLLIGIRLLLVCNISYVYSQKITYIEFRRSN